MREDGSARGEAGVPSNQPALSAGDPWRTPACPPASTGPRPPPVSARSRCINPADRRRIERLEIFDEFEEWHLIQVGVAGWRVLVRGCTSTAPRDAQMCHPPTHPCIHLHPRSNTTALRWASRTRPACCPASACRSTRRPAVPCRSRQAWAAAAGWAAPAQAARARLCLASSAECLRDA